MKESYLSLLKYFVCLIIGFLAYSPVIGQCEADAGEDITICVGESVTLGGSPTAINGGANVQYEWFVGNNNNPFSTVANPSVSPITTTTYVVELSGSGCGGEDDEITVTVLPVPNANFTFAPNNQCAGTTVNFTSTTTACPSCQYEWDFGNPASGGANTSPLQNPSHVFVAPGGASQAFTVSLTVTAANGCSDTQTYTVNVNQSPNAVLTEDQNFIQCFGASVFEAFVHDGSTPASNASYVINWGDGSPNYSSSTPPSNLQHNYNGINTWNLTYTVTGTNGCVDVQTYTVTNITNPSIGAANPGNTLQCGPVEFCFPLSSYSGNYPTTTYTVNFGDGSPTMVLNHPPPTSICHTYSTSTCNQSPNFFEFEIVAENDCATSTATISPIQIGMPPQALFSNPPAACAGSNVTFTNLSIGGYNLGCNPGTTYSWNFGDPASGAANTSTSVTGTHTYTQPGTYTVTLVAGNAGSSVLSCGTSTYTQTICIEQPPTPQFTVNTNVGCAPLAVVTDNTTSMAFASCSTPTTWTVGYTQQTCLPNLGTYSFTGGTSASSAEPQLLLSNPGTYSLTLTMANSCGPFTDVESITVNTVPVVSIAPLSTLCEGQSVTPSGTANGCNLPITAYAWSFNPGGSPLSSTSLNPGPITYAVDGTYPISFTATNACGPSTATSTVNVVNAPVVSIVSNDANNTICSGTTVTLTASGAASGYTWSPSTGLSSTTGATVTATLTGAQTYTVTGNGGTCTDTETITINIHPLPTVTPSAAFVTCSGTPVQLGVNVTGGTGPYSNYTWTPAATLNNANIANPTSSATTSLNYTVTAADANGCVGSGIVPLTVNTLPVVEAGNPITLCNQPVPTQLTGFSPSTGGTGTWTGPNVSSTGVFTPSGIGTFNLTYCFTSASTGCTACDNVTVTVVNPTPANAGPDTTACLNGAVINLPFLAPPNVNSWSGNPQVSANGVFTPTQLGTFTLTYTVGSGSCLATDQMQVTVLNNPTVNAGSDQTACAGTTVNMSAIANSPNGAITTYSWSGGITTAPNAANTSSTPAATTTYNVSVVDVEGCNAQDQITVTVSALPTVDAGGPLNLCNQPIATTLTPVNPVSGGTWSGPGVTSGGVYTPSGVGTFTLTYSFTNAAGCTNTDQLTVNVANAVIANAGDDVELCLNSGLYTIIPPITGPNATWSPAPVTASGQFNPTTVGTYTLTYSIGSGTCLTTDQMVLTVNPVPLANAGADQTICSGQTAQLNASASGGTTPYDYEWTNNPTLSNLTIVNPIASPAATTVYTFTVTDDNDCSSSDNITVNVNTLPTVDAGPNLTLCNQPIPEVLTGFSPITDGSGTGTWSGPGITNASGTFVSPGVGTYWIYYEYTFGLNACSNTDSIQITVNAPVISNAGADVTLCLNNGPYTLDGAPNNGTWSGVGVTAAPDPGTFNPEIAGVGTFTLTLSNGVGTCLNTDQMQITVNPLPVVSVGPDVAVCGNGDVFNMTGFTPSSGGTWEGNGITNAAIGTFDPAIAGPGSHPLFYWFEQSTTGCSDTSYVDVTVSPVPVANFTLAPLGCTNAAVNLSNTSTGFNQSEWEFGNGAVSTATNPIYTYPDEGIFDIQLIVTNAFGCADTASNTNEIIDPPFADFVLLPDSGCAPLDVSFQNLSVGQYLTYNWNLSTTTSTAQLPPNVIYQQGPDLMYYPISLTSTNFCGSHTANDQVVVFPQPVASFGPDLDVFCSPFTVEVNNTSTGLPDTFEWNWGDGGPSTLTEDPSGHVFFADTIPVQYTIELYLSNLCGADTAEYTITVLPNTVTAFFNTDIIEGCTPLQVEFTDYSEGGTQIQYLFGDGNFSGNANPTYTYNDPGFFTVQQIVDNGCSYDTATVDITIYPSPDIDFSVNVPNVCANNEVFFTADPGDAIDISWDFGDGGSSVIANPSYTFLNGGTFNVTMYGTNDYNCMSQITHPFTVYTAPSASFTVPNQVGCSPFDICFSNSTGGGVFYSWDFGDGNTDAGLDACNTYINQGSTPQLYTVSLIAQNMQLCADTFLLDVIVSPQPTSAFALTSFESCYFPVEVEATNFSLDANSYDWYIDGELVSDETNEDFTFDEVGTYQIDLTASNQFGCEHTSTSYFTVHPLPSLDFTFTPEDGCVPLEVQFTNNSAGASEYLWHLGDGSLSDAINPLHLYSSPGLYDVSLVATTTEGCQDTLSTIDAIEVYNLPIASFTTTPQETTIYTPTFTFYDDSYDASYWEWSFGDGTTLNFQNAFHTYTLPGTWPVTLTVWNEHGCEDSRNDVVVIQDIFNIFVPNAFTPDDDGINEYFKPVITGDAFIERYLFQVIDRWGTTIFETTNPDDAWTGDVRDGEYFAKDEAYNWQVIVQLKGIEGERVFYGHVVLIR